MVGVQWRDHRHRRRRWLVDRASQDTGVYLQFRCGGECDAGILLRAQKTGNETRGVLLSIHGEELSAYSVTLDAQEADRSDQATQCGGQINAPPVPPAPPFGSPARSNRPPFPQTATPSSRPSHVHVGLRRMTLERRRSAARCGHYSGILQRGEGTVSAATEDMNGFGPMHCVGGSTTVHFRAIAYKDLAMKAWPKEQLGKNYKMQRVNEFYYGWSAAAADFNHDGHLDIVSGPYIIGPVLRHREDTLRRSSTRPTPWTTGWNMPMTVRGRLARC